MPRCSASTAELRPDDLGAAGETLHTSDQQPALAELDAWRQQFVLEQGEPSHRQAKRELLPKP